MLYGIKLELYNEKVEIILLRRNTDKTILATSHPESCSTTKQKLFDWSIELGDTKL